MDTFAYVPSTAMQKKKPDLREATLEEEGLSVKEVAGINHNPDVWDIGFNAVKPAMASAIDDFVRTHKGTTPFLWVTPLGGTKQFTCSAVNVVPTDANLFDISMTLEQDFTPS